MQLRQPIEFPDGVTLSTYVREELLAGSLLVRPQAVLRAHRALQDAQRDVRLPHLVRRQGTSGPWSIRGVETDVGIGRPVVFTDNSPAIWLRDQLQRSQDRSGEVALDLVKRLHNKGVPAAAVLRTDEHARSPQWPLLRACMGPVYPEIWTAGWKLSHILPCSPQLGDPNDPLAALLIRDPAEYFRVRSLRNMSPFNFFLTPTPARYEMVLDGRTPAGRDLGEDPKIIGWVVRLLREVYGAHGEAGAAFDEFLEEASLGARAFDTVSDGAVRVVAKAPAPPDRGPRPPRAGLLARTHPSVTLGTPGPSQGRVYQINQGVSNETYGGLLCAPDANKGGWTRLREMQPGDVILHNVKARLVAVSVVEPMQLDDPRLLAFRSRIRQRRPVVGACLPYGGDHLTVEGRPETDFLVCLISTVLRDQSLATAVTYSGYAVEVRADRLADRPDLVRVAAMARAAAAPMLAEGAP